MELQLNTLDLLTRDPTQQRLVMTLMTMMMMTMGMIGDEMGLVVMIVVQRDDSLVVKPKINI